MNGISGFAARFPPYDIRAGSLRDLAHIPEQEMLGIGNPAVAKAAGHRSSSLAAGTTDKYIGYINQDLNQLKAKYLYNDRSVPTAGAPLRKKGRISTKENNARLPDVPADPDNKENISKRSKMARTIQKKREAHRFLEAAQHNLSPPPT